MSCFCTSSGQWTRLLLMDLLIVFLPNIFVCLCDWIESEDSQLMVNWRLSRCECQCAHLCDWRSLSIPMPQSSVTSLSSSICWEVPVRLHNDDRSVIRMKPPFMQRLNPKPVLLSYIGKRLKQIKVRGAEKDFLRVCIFWNVNNRNKGKEPIITCACFLCFTKLTQNLNCWLCVWRELWLCTVTGPIPGYNRTSRPFMSLRFLLLCDCINNKNK